MEAKIDQKWNGFWPILKPPIGLRPRWLHDQQRLLEITWAAQRYLEAGKPVPDYWLKEMFEIIREADRRRAEERAPHG